MRMARKQYKRKWAVFLSTLFSLGKDTIVPFLSTADLISTINLAAFLLTLLD
jgi:hypothetical protein